MPLWPLNIPGGLVGHDCLSFARTFSCWLGGMVHPKPSSAVGRIMSSPRS